MPTSSRTTSSSVTPRLRGNNAPGSKSQSQHDLLQVGAESAADRLREGGGPEAGSRGGGQADRARQGGQISHGTQYAILFSSAHNLTPGLLRDSRQRLLPAVRPVHRGDDQQEQVDCQGPVPAVVAGQGKPGRQPTQNTQNPFKSKLQLWTEFFDCMLNPRSEEREFLPCLLTWRRRLLATLDQVRPTGCPTEFSLHVAERGAADWACQGQGDDRDEVSGKVEKICNVT